jgi:ribosome-binding factor A
MSPRSERARFGKTGRGYQRKDRVSEQLREVLAEALERRDEADLDRVTITGVDCSPDLRQATVYYTVLGDEQLQIRVAAELTELAPSLRTHVARTVRLRHTPALTFAHDTFLERGLRIERLLQELHRPEGADASEEDA